MQTQNPEMKELLAQLLARPRRQIDQSPEAQLQRRRDRYLRLAQVGDFPAPAPDADGEALEKYRLQYDAQLADADILDEIQRISRGER